jgi:hypothetical protein
MAVEQEDGFAVVRSERCDGLGQALCCVGDHAMDPDELASCSPGRIRMSDERPPVAVQPPDRRGVAAVHPARGCDLEAEAFRDCGEEPIHLLTLEFRHSKDQVARRSAAPIRQRGKAPPT